MAYAKKVEVKPYSDFVEYLADEKLDVLIPNGRSDHAKVIVNNLLSHAEKEVRIFSNRLKLNVYEDKYIFESLGSFLRKKGRLRIVLQDVDLDDGNEEDNCRKLIEIKDKVNLEPTDAFKKHPFIKACSEYDVSIKLAEGVDRDNKEHFIIMDELAFRFCEDRETEEAIASFNDPETSRNLADKFDTIDKCATPIRYKD